MLRLEQLPGTRRRRLAGGLIALEWSAPLRFDAGASELIYATITRLASEVFGDDMSPYWAKRRAGGFLEQTSRLTIIVDGEGRPVGWASHMLERVDGRVCIYLDAGGILPEYQALGVIQGLTARNILAAWRSVAFRPMVAVMRTESPIVYQAILGSLGEHSLFPRRDGSPPPDWVQSLGQYIATKLGQAELFDPRSLRIADAFGGRPCPWRWTADLRPLTGVALTTRDEQTNAFFRRTVRPSDTLIIVFECRLLGLARAWLRAASRAARRRLGPMGSIARSRV